MGRCRPFGNMGALPQRPASRQIALTDGLSSEI